MKPKRINKSKKQIVDEIELKAKVARQKEMVKRVFPLLKDLDNLYEAQTALMAVSGYLKEDIEKKMSIFKVNDIALDFKDEPKTKITEVMTSIKAELQNDCAVEAMDMLELFGNFIPNIGAEAYLKKPANELTLEDLKL